MPILPGNSLPCQTHGLLYKQQLVQLWYLHYHIQPDQFGQDLLFSVLLVQYFRATYTEIILQFCKSQLIKKKIVSVLLLKSVIFFGGRGISQAHLSVVISLLILKEISGLADEQSSNNHRKSDICDSMWFPVCQKVGEAE